MNKKTATKLAVLSVIIFSAYKVFAFIGEEPSLDFSSAEKIVKVNDNGLEYGLTTKENEVWKFLEENKIYLGDHDEIIPAKDAKISNGTNIRIRRASKIEIRVDGEKLERYVLGRTVREVLAESQVKINRIDVSSPDFKEIVQNEMVITVTRINVEEISEIEEIDFKIIAKEDKRLGWREKKIETAGVKGKKEVRYRVTYKNGKETSRVKLATKILEEPVSQVETQGTYMKLGKANRGQGTWYAWKGGMFAASTTIPKGEFVKVTAVASGKSVVVQINDYGPQGEGRIIDLDKVAFEKLAPIGAGVIDVKVEHILN